MKLPGRPPPLLLNWGQWARLEAMLSDPPHTAEHALKLGELRGWGLGAQG